MPIQTSLQNNKFYLLSLPHHHLCMPKLPFKMINIKFCSVCSSSAIFCIFFYLLCLIYSLTMQFYVENNIKNKKNKEVSMWGLGMDTLFPIWKIISLLKHFSPGMEWIVF